MSDQQKFQWPSALDINAYYKLFKEILDDLKQLTGIGKPERKERFNICSDLHDVFSIVHGNYIEFLSQFEDNLNQSASLMSNSAGRSKKEHREGEDLFRKSKRDFIEKRRELIGRRAEVKGFAGGYIQSAIDMHEARFLYVLLWYFQYQDDRGYSRLSEFEVDHGIENPIGQDVEKHWDSATSSLQDRISELPEPLAALEEVRKTIRFINDRFALVEKYFFRLRVAWKMLPRKERIGSSP